MEKAKVKAEIKADIDYKNLTINIKILLPTKEEFKKLLEELLEAEMRGEIKILELKIN
jgi:hypothetical protein